MKKLYREIVTEQMGEHILASTFREATKAEINETQQSFQKGICNHGVFYDKSEWMYDIRKCGACHKTIGFI